MSTKPGFVFEIFWKIWKILGNTGPFPTFQKALKNVGFLKSFEKYGKIWNVWLLEPAPLLSRLVYVSGAVLVYKQGGLRGGFESPNISYFAVFFKTFKNPTFFYGFLKSRDTAPCFPIFFIFLYKKKTGFEHMVVWNHFIYSVCVGHVHETRVLWKFWKIWKFGERRGRFLIFKKPQKSGIFEKFWKYGKIWNVWRWEPPPPLSRLIYRVSGWNRNRKPGIGTQKGSFRQNFSWNANFCSAFVEKGVTIFLVCVQKSPRKKTKKVPSRTNSLLKVATFGP